MNSEKDFNKVKDSVNTFAKEMEGKQIEVSGRRISFLQVGVLAAICAQVIFSFLPFIEGGVSVGGVSVSSSVNFFDAGGWHLFLVLAMLAGICVFTIMNKKLFAVVCSGINLLIVFYDAFISGGEARSYITVCVGAYLMIIAAVLIMLIGVVGFMHERRR